MIWLSLLQKCYNCNKKLLRKNENNVNSKTSTSYYIINKTLTLNAQLFKITLTKQAGKLQAGNVNFILNQLEELVKFLLYIFPKKNKNMLSFFSGQFH